MPGSQRVKKWRTALKITLLSLALLGSGAAGYSGYLVHKANVALDRMSASTDPSPVITQPLSAYTVTAEEEWQPMTFLLTGVDHRAGSGGSMNADVLMLVSLNPGTSTATIVSIPRDLQMKPKKFGLSPQKINYYYAYYYNQDKQTAIAKTKTLYSQMFEVPIDYMVVIDFDGFREIVDELNGLEMNVDMDMRYVDEEDGTNINLKKGLQSLDGKQTLDYLRYRKSNRGTAESSDLARNERQQEVLNKLMGKLTSFSGITQWGGLLDIAGRNVKTDIPADNLRRFVLSLPKLMPSSIEFIHLDGRWDSPYIVPKEADLRAALNALTAHREQPADSLSGDQTVTRATYDRLTERFGVEPEKKETVKPSLSKADISTGRSSPL